MESNVCDTFIEVYPNAFNDQFCKDAILKGLELIDEDYKGKWGSKAVGDQPKYIRDDSNTIVSPRLKHLWPDDLLSPMNKILTQLFDDYQQKYWMIQSLPKILSGEAKFHHVSPGGGYHQWHCEQEGGYSVNRVLAWHLSLNNLDKDDDGSLEFLNFNTKIKPKAGQVVIWPAFFTHAHRGNMTRLGDKYYLTGWFSYA